MDLFSRFKKDYFNYLISIILPASISAVSIPVFKHLLGAEGYGKFSIWLNAILIITAVLSGWISQSIIRFFPSSTDRYSFSRNSMVLSIYTQIIFFIPVFVGAWYFSHDIWLSILCSLVLFATSIQFSILPIIQSNFLSKKIIASETIRMLVYLGCSVCLLKYTGIPYLYSLFVAAFASYCLSLIYLIRQAHNFFKAQNSMKNSIHQAVHLFKSFFNYGASLSLWLVFAYLLSYIDKLFMFKYMGAELQGNYQAIFDLLFRGIALVISPIVTSLFPILTSAYERGDNKEIRELMKKIISYELTGFLLVSILYWSFGSNLLLALLKIPNTSTFRLIGFIVICGAFIWQIAILAQKRFELKQKTFFLLAMVFISFATQLLFYVMFENYNNPLVYPLGFLLSAFVYLLLISVSELLIIAKSIRTKIKISKH